MYTTCPVRQSVSPRLDSTHWLCWLQDNKIAHHEHPRKSVPTIFDIFTDERRCTFFPFRFIASPPSPQILGSGRVEMPIKAPVLYFFLVATRRLLDAVSDSSRTCDMILRAHGLRSVSASPDSSCRIRDHTGVPLRRGIFSFCCIKEAYTAAAANLWGRTHSMSDSWRLRSA